MAESGQPRRHSDKHVASDAATHSIPTVSVLIVNHNTRDLLRDCLDSVCKVDYQPCEVIVVDNGSHDGSAHMVRSDFPSVQLVTSLVNLGFVGGHLLGYARATGDYVCFLNSDTQIEADSLNELIKFMEANPDAGACTPKILWMEDPSQIDCIGDYLTATGMMYHYGYRQKDQGFDTPHPIFAAKGVCLLVRASVLDEVGMFDDSYFAYFEETDLCWRIWLAGYKVYFVPSARILHRVAATSRSLDSYLVNYHAFKNRIQSLLKNLGLFYLLKILPIHVLVCVGLFAVYCLRGRRRKARAIADALAWNIFNLNKTMMKRRHVQGVVRRRDDRSLMKFAWAAVPWRYYLNLYREYDRV